MAKTAPKTGKLKRQKSRQDSRGYRTRMGLFALTFLVLLIVCGKLISLVQGISQPIAPDSPVGQKTYQWDGTGRLNIVVQADNLYLFSFNPGSQSANLLLIPPEMYLNLPLGFGQYQAGSVYQLGQSEQPPLGARLLKEGMENTLAVPVDNYFLVGKNFSEEPFPKVLEKIRQNPIQAAGLLRGSKTDLSLKEYFLLMLSLRNVREDKISESDISESTVTSWELLPNGSRVLGINKPDLEQFAQGQLEDTALQNEEFSVGVYNATNHPQLAEKAARLVRDMGGRVIFTSNLSSDMKNSVVIGKKSYTSRRLGQIFTPNCPVEVSAHDSTKPGCQPVGFDQSISRADVNLILGEDYYREFQ